MKTDNFGKTNRDEKARTKRKRVKKKERENVESFFQDDWVRHCSREEETCSHSVCVCDYHFGIVSCF